MLDYNRSNLQLYHLPATSGIPGLRCPPMDLHPLLSGLPTVTDGECCSLLIIKADHKLRTYVPLSMHALSYGFDTYFFYTSQDTQSLLVQWTERLTLEACLTQMYFIHSLSTMESGFILAMAFLTWFAAICHPLRHSTILTPGVIVGLGLLIVFRGAVLQSTPLSTRWLSYCKTNAISHTYCEFMALIKLVCSETKIRRAYSLIVVSLTGGLDFTDHLFYILILFTVFNLPSKAARLKTLSTCVSHVWVILVFYTPAFFSFSLIGLVTTLLHLSTFL